MTLFQRFRIYIREMLDPSDEQEREEDTVESIRKGIEFRGTNLWVLIFATFIASLGLNTNSTAVIIGAMLISPLMGPIMGIGLGVGINDFELIKKSFRNLLIATVFSVLTSTLYFLLSPLNEARSELLARTTPTIYDVLIAFFGGMAGIVASATKLKGNVIPGVAIATALMPPLCTAGFGLASGNLTYFFGAFYLFTINSVFIAVATTLGVRLMHFSKKKFMDKVREKKVHRIVYSIIILTMVPSVYITYNMVKTNIFETNASRFIKNEFNFPSTLVVERYVKSEKPERRIEVSLIGKEISEEVIVSLKQKMGQYGLHDVPLLIHQGFGKEDASLQNDVSNMLLQDYYMQNKERISEQEVEIAQLKARLSPYLLYDTIGRQISPEVKILYPSVKSIAISQVIRNGVDSMHTDTLTIAIVKIDRDLQKMEEEQFVAWLTARVGVKKLKLIKEKQGDL